MKDKIFVFIIGLLLGAVITAGSFLADEKGNKYNNQMPNNEGMQMMERPDGEEPPQRPDDMQNDGTRPEPPSRDNQPTGNINNNNNNSSSN